MHTGKWLPLAALFILTAFSAAGCRETVMTTETQTRTTIPPDAQGDAASTNPDISADGRFVVFKSDATNLVVGSTNGARTIYIRDTQTGVTTRVSSDSAGVNGNMDSDNPALSADGRFVAFDSIASNLVPGDTGSQCVSASGTNINCPDVFIKNLESGETRLVSAATAGEPGNRESQQPALSADGSVVAFRSAATNLVEGDTNGKADVFLKDVQTGKVARVSVSAEGSEGNEDSEQPAISADGRFVAFHTFSDSLLADDTNGKEDVYLKDTQTGALTRVSTSADGSQGDEASGFFNLALSADGRFVAFESGATNLVADDLNGKRDVFLKDTQSGAISLVSVSATGAQGEEDSYRSISVSTDGRFVAFSSDAPNLVAGDNNAGNGKTDVFIRDMWTVNVACISTSTGSAVPGKGKTEFLSISGDGRFVAFSSDGADLVPGDTNKNSDVFLKDTKTGVTTRISTSTADTGPAPGLTITDRE